VRRSARKPARHEVIGAGGFQSVRRATETPFNMALQENPGVPKAMGGDRPTRGGVGNAPAVSARRLPGTLGGGTGFERSVPGRERAISVLANGTITEPTRGGPGTVSMLKRNRWFESISLQQTVCLSPGAAFEGREPGFPRGFGQLACQPGQQRLAGCFDIASTGGNISVGRYSSTAVRLVVAPGLTRDRSVDL
jgi:hypothetical protein